MTGLEVASFHGKRMGITLRMSDQACEIIPGRRLLRQYASIPNSTPSAVITITILLPWYQWPMPKRTAWARYARRKATDPAPWMRYI